MSLIESIKYITPFSKNYVKESISEPDLQGFLCTQIIDEFQQMYACQNKTKCRMSKGKKNYNLRQKISTQWLWILPSHHLVGFHCSYSFCWYYLHLGVPSGKIAAQEAPREINCSHSSFASQHL